MPVLKRPAAVRADAGARSVAKKAKQAEKPLEEKLLDKVRQGLGEVAAPPEVLEMLGNVLPWSLLIFPEDRHVYQQQAVDLIGSELQKGQEQLQEVLTQGEELLERWGTDKADSDLIVTSSNSEFKARQTQAVEKKHELASAAIEFRTAKEGLASAEATQISTDAELKEAERQHNCLSSIIADTLEPLKEGTVARNNVQEAASGLVPKLQEFFQVEESLIPAIPAVLAKEPSARGAFDAVAVVRLEEQARKALDDLSAIMKGGEGRRSEQSSVIEAAQEALAVAKQKQRDRAAAFQEARDMEMQAQAALAAARNKHKGLTPERDRRSKMVQRAKTALSEFCDGPMAAFQELSRRSKVPVEEPVAEAPAEAAPEEQNPAQPPAAEADAAEEAQDAPAAPEDTAEAEAEAQEGE